MIYFCPKRTEIGAGFAFRYRLPQQFWLTVATSVVQLKHRLNIGENILDNGGSGPDVGYGYKSLCAMINAGCPQWNYGKFYNGCLKKTGVPEVELCIGHDHDHADVGTTQGFLGVTIPTGSQACQRYMFEPMVGNGRHVGILSGLVGEYVVLQGQDTMFRLVTSGLLRYTCSHAELRSFDLKGKPWSRYMFVWNNRDALGDPAVAANVTAALGRLVPLINYSTICADISPNWSLDANAGVQCEHGNFSCELGYHAYARQAEELCFCGACIQDDIGLQAFSHYSDWATDPLPVTRSFATINSPVLGASPNSVDYLLVGSQWNATYVRITTDSLDQSSALAPAAFAQTLYGALAYQFDTRVPLKALIGASYTAASDNSYPSGWKVWGTVAFAF